MSKKKMLMRKFGVGILPFVSTWKTDNISTGSSANNQVKLPLYSLGVYNFTVNWGDGNSDVITIYNQAETTHTYGSIGTYTVTITGICEGWYFNNGGDKLKIKTVESWGCLDKITGSAFFGCTNLTLTTVSDILNLSNVSSLEGVFRSCPALTTINRINEWDTTTIVSFALLFYGATNFNDNISNWNTANVFSFNLLFTGCIYFNQPLNSWNTGNVVDMSFAFNGCQAFNQPLNLWNVVKVTNMSTMFSGATSFNQDISGWNVGLVTNMTNLFYNCLNFNQPLNSWNTISVTNMNGTFRATRDFNQPLNLWNTANVLNMTYMFQGVSAFNQDISGWNTGKVTNFGYMFYLNTSFNQNVGNWNVTACNSFENMLYKAWAFSIAKYDNLLNGWSVQAVKPSKALNMYLLNYTIATSQAARDILTNAPNSWTILDGGGI